MTPPNAVSTPATPTDWLDLARSLGPILAERARDADERDAFVAENVRTLRDRKLYSAAVPVELGGGGATHRETCAVVRELARHCSSTALAFSMHQHLVAASVWKHLRGQPGGGPAGEGRGRGARAREHGSERLDGVERHDGAGRRGLPGHGQEALRQRQPGRRPAHHERPLRGPGGGLAGPPRPGPPDRGRGPSRRVLGGPGHAGHRIPHRGPRRGLRPPTRRSPSAGPGPPTIPCGTSSSASRCP